MEAIEALVAVLNMVDSHYGQAPVEHTMLNGFVDAEKHLMFLRNGFEAEQAILQKLHDGTFNADQFRRVRRPV